MLSQFTNAYVIKWKVIIYTHNNQLHGATGMWYIRVQFSTVVYSKRPWGYVIGE